MVGIKQQVKVAQDKEANDMPSSPVSPRLIALACPRSVTVRNPSFKILPGASPGTRRRAKKANDHFSNPEYIEVGPQRTTLASTLHGNTGHAGFTQFKFAQGSRFVGKGFAAKKDNQAFPTHEYTEVGPQRTTLAATLRGDKGHDVYTELAFAQGPKYVGRNFSVPINTFQKGFSQPEYVEEGGEVQPFATMVEMVQGRGPRELFPRHKGSGLQMHRYLNFAFFYLCCILFLLKYPVSCAHFDFHSAPLH